MKLRLAAPDYLIDIDPLADELGYIAEHDDEVRIGAMTRHRALLESRRSAPARDLHRRRARDRRPRGPQPRHDRRRALPGRPVRGPVRGVRRGRRADGDPAARGERVVGHARVPPPAPTRPRSARRRCWSRSACPRAGAGSAYEKVDRRVGDWAVVAAGAALELARTARSRAPASRSPRPAGTSRRARPRPRWWASRRPTRSSRARRRCRGRMRPGHRPARIGGVQTARRRRPDGARPATRHRAGTSEEGGVTDGAPDGRWG